MDLDGLSLKGGESQAFGFMDSLGDYQFGFLKEICLFEFGYLLFGLPCLALGLRIGVPGSKWIGVERGISHKGFQF